MSRQAVLYSSEEDLPNTCSTSKTHLMGHSFEYGTERERFEREREREREEVRRKERQEKAREAMFSGRLEVGLLVARTLGYLPPRLVLACDF